GAAYESLGLVARTFHPELIADIDRELQQGADDILGYFWHGIGRAIYFALRNFLPCCEIDWAGAPEAAPHETGRLNITAGLAWAVTMVTRRHPALVARLLRRHGADLSRTPAFANGMASALVVRHDTTPDADLDQPLCNYRPGSAGGGVEDVALWDRL